MDKTELGKKTKAELVELALSLGEDAVVTDWPEPENVHQAINQLMGRVGYVQKEQSQGLNYSFASEPAFIQAVRPHMVDLGLTIRQIGVEPIEFETYQTKKGSTAFSRIYEFVFEWVHTPSGTSMTVTAVGEGTDYGDKASNKAMTVALKYALRQTLLIETGDDPDQFSSDDFERGREEKLRQGFPENGDGQLPRKANQWEKEVVDTIMETYATSMEIAKPHVVNVLNNSLFVNSVPYGQLIPLVGLAYVLAWQEAKSKYPDDDTPARAVRVNVNWEKIKEGFLDTARVTISEAVPVEETDGLY